MTDKVSVVIATLGGESLDETIKCLNSGTVIPSEIIISIPKEYIDNIQAITYENVKILEVDVKGQVAQRALGFNSASFPIVVQLDDDVLVDALCLEELIKTLKNNGEKPVVGAAIYETASNKTVYKKVGGRCVWQKIYYWLLNGKDGYQEGIVDKAGVNIGVSYDAQGNNEISVQWLAGGCVAHYKSNVILEDFYPYKGKAYSEDLIHSYLLISSGCKLIVNKSAKCYIDVLYSKDMSFKEFWGNFKADYRARNYYVKLTNRNLLRMQFYYMAWLLSYFSRTFRS